MAIEENSSLKSWAITRVLTTPSPSDWLILPSGFQDYGETQEEIYRLDNTVQYSLYTPLEITAPVLPWKSWLKLNNWYNLANQNILLNYHSPYPIESGGDLLDRWCYAPAKFSVKPKRSPGNRGGRVAHNVVLQFEAVEWYIKSS